MKVLEIQAAKEAAAVLVQATLKLLSFLESSELFGSLNLLGIPRVSVCSAVKIMLCFRFPKPITSMDRFVIRITCNQTLQVEELYMNICFQSQV